MTRTLRFVFLLCITVSTGLASGCKQTTFGDISGTVTLDGNPVSAGQIIFVDSLDKPQTGEIKNGAYTVKRVPTGKATIAVIPQITVTFGGPAAGGNKGPDIPVKYGDPKQSNLSFDVKQGQNKFDVPLKSQG